MPAYYKSTVSGLVAAKPDGVVGQLEIEYARDGFMTQFAGPTRAWADLIPILQNQLQSLMDRVPDSRSWTVLLEYPLYRLRKRIDVVLLASTTIVVVEAKVGEREFHSVDERQVEEYALDLRDF